MKKVSSLLTGVFLIAGVYAQEVKDTVPSISSQSSAVAKDTIPSVRKDTMPSWRRDSINWQKDSMQLKGRRDTLGRQNNSDSLNHSSWNTNDSLHAADNNKKWQDTSGVTSKNDHWKDTTAMDKEKKGIKDTSGVAVDDKTKWDNKNEKMKKNEVDTTPVVKTKKLVKDRLMMKDGEMVIIKKGKETKMVKSIKLPDGNIVMTDGTIKMPDGNTIKLKEGEYINLSPKASKGS